MKAYVTSIGEPTTELCEWALERQGFDVVTIQNNESLGRKLKKIYELASVEEEDFVRVDADVIVNWNARYAHRFENPYWWQQFMTFDMYKQDLTNGGVQLISHKILPTLLDNIDRFIDDDRPETRMWRLEAFDGERSKFHSSKTVMGIHGFGQKDLGRVRNIKDGRKYADDYDWELAYKMMEFYK